MAVPCDLVLFVGVFVFLASASSRSSNRSIRTCWIYGTPANNNDGVSNDGPSSTWVYYRPFTNLDDAIAGPKADFVSCVDKLDMRPLVPMVMHIVRDLGEQNALGAQDAVRLPVEMAGT